MTTFEEQLLASLTETNKFLSALDGFSASLNRLSGNFEKMTALLHGKTDEPAPDTSSVEGRLKSRLLYLLGDESWYRSQTVNNVTGKAETTFSPRHGRIKSWVFMPNGFVIAEGADADIDVLLHLIKAGGI